jgi:LPS-assembly protein
MVSMTSRILAHAEAAAKIAARGSAMRSALTLAMLAAWPALAIADDAPLLLKRSEQLRDWGLRKPSATEQSDKLPVFVRGDRVRGRPDLETAAEGRAELRSRSIVLKADRLEYDAPTDRAKATGQVRVLRDGNLFTGSELELTTETFEGFLTQSSYRLHRTGGEGTADRIDFLGPNELAGRNATYSTCKPCANGSLAWQILAGAVRFDQVADEGEAKDARMMFLGRTLMSAGSLGFPLSDARRSGWLSPQLGADTLNGIDVLMPYYWNIAPNRDLTLTPRIASKRGFELGSEFRYLEPLYRGDVRADVMPQDALRRRARWAVAARHSQSLPGALGGNAALNVSLNRVSDDDYWKDSPRGVSALTQRLLSSEALASWSAANGLVSGFARAQQWQTLQDVASPIRPPYGRLPQVVARMTQPNLGGFELSAEADATRFEAQRLDPRFGLASFPNGTRVFTRAGAGFPIIQPGWYVTPRLSIHATRYSMDSPLAGPTGQTPLPGATNEATRVLPTATLDAGMFFERDASYFGRAWRQTLEPRLYYVNTPFRQQTQLPLFDTGVADFNFASIFTDNTFAGNDRIADANNLTLGLTSRLIDPSSGVEGLRVGLAQRYRFRQQRVTLDPNEPPISERFSDTLAGATVGLVPHWLGEGIVQYNARDDRFERISTGVRYNPTPYRTLSVAYRYSRSLSNSIDVGWQWPLTGGPDELLPRGQGLGADRLYTVGRVNYSRVDRRITNALIGFEYDAGCWLGRVVLERVSLSPTSANQRIMFQLEFVGFSRVGINPLSTLRRNVPRYQMLRETLPDGVSRYSNYE